MADEGAVAVQSTDTTTDGLGSLGVEAVEVRDSVGRNVVIAVIGLVLVMAALVPLLYGALWVGSIVYAAVVSFLTGGPAEPPGAAV
ncbi:hypothetical protein [Agromyces sp. ZXT2-6]|uniref:hypothetical protein n=1 Tax=Agromyces sp. ZXT2-6 TaxID=3461153 RepID=UPI0040553103